MSLIDDEERAQVRLDAQAHHLGANMAGRGLSHHTFDLVIPLRADNDTANVIIFDGTSPQGIGRSYGMATVLTPQKKNWASSNWGTAWHHFRMRAKFNSGTSPATEVADGAYYVEIDGQVYVDAKGLLNRHYSNAPIDRIELFGWAQSGSSPFEIWYDDVRISTGGFVDPAVPSPPTNLAAH